MLKPCLNDDVVRVQATSTQPEIGKCQVAYYIGNIKDFKMIEKHKFRLKQECIHWPYQEFIA